MFTLRSWALLTSIAVVVVAVLALLITGSPDSDPVVASTPSPTDSTTEPSEPSEPLQPSVPEPTPSPDPEPEKKPEKEPDEKPTEPRRSPTPSAYVEVFNNSGVTGLAGETASQLSAAGWQVLGADNWYGDIPATTVYYPERLKAQAELLADEVGATRTRPAVEPMRFDRLTLILTGDL